MINADRVDKRQLFINTRTLHHEQSSLNLTHNMSNLNKAADRLKSLTERPSNEEFLNLYGLFKQATVGENTTSKPGMFDMKGQFKWKAWKDKTGMSQDAAADAYVALVDELLTKYQHD